MEKGREKMNYHNINWAENQIRLKESYGFLMYISQ